jgi:hypothetical protein
MRISTEYIRDNAIETSRVAVNDVKMLEEATRISDTTSSSLALSYSLGRTEPIKMSG